LEQAVALASDTEIQPEDLPALVRSATPTSAAPAGAAATTTFKEAKQQLVERFERQFITDALARHQGNISKAADELGMYRQQLQSKLAEYEIDAAGYRSQKD
jgi:DNA-binding NtrC family response regulator